MIKANFIFFLLVNLILVNPVFGQKIIDAKNIFTPQAKILQSHLIQIEKQKHQFDSIKIKSHKLNYKYGDTSNDIIAIKKKLILLGDMKPYVVSNVFDSILLLGINNYQKRNGLRVSNLIKNDLIQKLNLSLEFTISKIKLNIKRWAVFDTLSCDEYILINIPEYELRLIKNKNVEIQMKVVVGKTTNKTPLLNSTINQIVFCPYWNVPNSILIKEIQPLIKRFPNYLSTFSMEWKDGKLRQLPGRSNALGLIKFIFPNPYDVYMHDTPMKNLFKENERFFSHGCIRLEHPRKLAIYLLNDSIHWSGSSIDSILNHNKEQWVKINKHMPIMIKYFTAWIDENGYLQLRKDIYNLDEKSN
jgi:murein L,D-transpeptidase YcbB/YkuD